MMGFVLSAPARAGEVRTLSLYHVHTHEKLTVTYKVDGRYIPAAMTKINYLLRDWRKNKVITIDPKVVDLMWELHEDLGSDKPIDIICGYRSAETNAFLRRIGRHVAVRSQHIHGKAIDLFFPDVSTMRLRNSALVRKIGGVGFYPRSGIKGFVHLDSGSVRHWPYISETHMAQIMRQYRSTVGARFARRSTNTMVAALDTSKAAYKPVISAPQKIAMAMLANVPKPRPKPIEVKFLAAMAAKMQVIPASAAPVPHNNLAALDPTSTKDRGWLSEPKDRLATNSSNFTVKGNLLQEIDQGTATNVPLIKPIEEAADSANGSIMGFLRSWLTMSPDRLIRRDGYPQPLTVNAPTYQSEVAKGLSAEDRQALQQFSPMSNTIDKASADTIASVSNQSGKSDMLVANEEAKSDFGPDKRPPLNDKVAEAVTKTTP